MDVGQHFHHLLATAAIQGAGRFVGQQHGWVIDQRASDGDALALAAGKLRGIGAGFVAQA